MVIFHSYVSLPEGIQCWKSSTTQVSQAPRTTKQPPSKNLQHWHHPNGRPKYIWVPMNIPNCFFLYPLGIPNAIHRRYLLRTLFHANPQLKFSSQSAEVCWSVHHRGTILSATDAERHAAARHPQLRWSKSSHTMAETHGCLAVNYTFNGRCKNQRWEHVLSLTWIHANQKHLVTNW